MVLGPSPPPVRVRGVGGASFRPAALGGRPGRPTAFEQWQRQAATERRPEGDGVAPAADEAGMEGGLAAAVLQKPSAAPGEEATEASLDAGSVVFVCADLAQIFYDASSHDTIGEVAGGERLLVTAPPVRRGGFTMVPIQLHDGGRGFVQRELLSLRPPDVAAAAAADEGRGPSAGVAGRGVVAESVVAQPQEVLPSALDRELVYREALAEGACAPLRIVSFGDSLSSEVMGEDRPVYARHMARALAEGGTPVELVGCGLPGRTALQLAAALDLPMVTDVHKHEGVGLLRLVQPRQGGVDRVPDLVLIMAGTNDLLLYSKTYNMAQPEHIAQALQFAHEECHKLGARTVVLGIPSLSGQCARPETLARLRAVNGRLAAWVRLQRQTRSDEGEGRLLGPELFINPDSLLPNGPRARRAGLWERDGIHWSREGALAFGERLARRLRPLAERLRSERVLESAGSADADGGQAFPLEVYLKALSIQEASGFDDGLSDVARRLEEAGPWELEAAALLQRTFRGALARRRTRREAAAEGAA